MKKIQPIFYVAICLLLLLVNGCKKSGGSPGVTNTYTLTVSLGEGITGTPATGSHIYTEGQQVNYSYSLADGYRDLVVTHDWDLVNAQGSFTMNQDYRLTASHAVELQHVLQVRTASNFREPSDVIDFLEMLEGVNVYAVEMTVKQDEDDEYPSGHVFYNSSIVPVAEDYTGFDALQTMLREAHSRGLLVCAWLPQFHDKAAVDRNPTWQMRALVDGEVVPYLGRRRLHPEYFVNPVNGNLQNYQLSIIKEVVESYDIDGIYIDWVRFDNWNMDMNDSTREAYRNSAGIDPVEIDFSTDNQQRRDWNLWRKTVIADYVDRVKETIQSIKPGLPLGVHLLPPEFREVAQDAARFQIAADHVAPLAYWDDWGFASSWTWRTLLYDVVTGVPESKVVPDLDTDWSRSDTSTILESIRIYYPQIKKIAWFRYGKWRQRNIDKIRDVQ